MSILFVSLITSMSLAADLNDDGCDDGFYDANAACVDVSAAVGSGVTIGSNTMVGEQATIGADTALGSDVFIGNRTSLVGRVSASGARPVGNGTVIGRQTTVGADHSIGADNTIGRAAVIGERLDTGANVGVGFAAVLGDDVTLVAGAYVGNLVDIGNNTTIGGNAVLGRDVTVLDSTGTAVIEGIVGPGASIGSDSTIADGARIRKDAIVGDDVTVNAGARIARDSLIGDGAVVGANVRIGAYAEVTATSIVPDGTVLRRREVYDNPAVVSQFNTVAFSPSNVAGGCSYQSMHAVQYQNIGSMDWRSCMSAAAQRGAAVSSNVHMTNPTASTSGWVANRNGNVAMYAASYTQYLTQNITSSRSCVLTKDPRSPGISVTLAGTTTYDGDVWKFQDYGSRYYDQCVLLAANSGASIITPSTIGLSGTNYWVPTQHACNVYNFTTNNTGTVGNQTRGGGSRSALRSCMVGFLDQEG